MFPTASHLYFFSRLEKSRLSSLAESSSHKQEHRLLCQLHSSFLLLVLHLCWTVSLLKVQTGRMNCKQDYREFQKMQVIQELQKIWKMQRINRIQKVAEDPGFRLFSHFWDDSALLWVYSRLWHSAPSGFGDKKHTIAGCSSISWGIKLPNPIKRWPLGVRWA